MSSEIETYVDDSYNVKRVISQFKLCLNNTNNYKIDLPLFISAYRELVK